MTVLGSCSVGRTERQRIVAGGGTNGLNSIKKTSIDETVGHVTGCFLFRFRTSKSGYVLLNVTIRSCVIIPVKSHVPRCSG